MPRPHQHQAEMNSLQPCYVTLAEHHAQCQGPAGEAAKQNSAICDFIVSSCAFPAVTYQTAGVSVCALLARCSPSAVLLVRKQPTS